LYGDGTRPAERAAGAPRPYEVGADC